MSRPKRMIAVPESEDRPCSLCRRNKPSEGVGYWVCGPCITLAASRAVQKGVCIASPMGIILDIAPEVLSSVSPEMIRCIVSEAIRMGSIHLEAERMDKDPHGLKGRSWYPRLTFEENETRKVIRLSIANG